MGGARICRINSRGFLESEIVPHFKGYVYSIAETPDNGYLVGGARRDAVECGSPVEFDENGNITGQRPEKEWNCQSPVYQTFVAKTDAGRNLIWQASLGKEGLRDPVQSIIKADLKTGYVFQTKKDAIRLDENGKYLNAIHFYDLQEAGNESLSRQILRKYFTSPRVNPSDSKTDPPKVVFFDEQGSAVAIQSLRKVSQIISLTDDGGYVSAYISGSSGLNIIRLNPDGTKIMEIPIHGVTISQVVGIVETSDGGYALLCGIDKA